MGGFGGILACSGAVLFFDLGHTYLEYLAVAGIPLAVLTGVYTAWLFGQAKGRNWSEDRLLAPKMFVEMVIIGVASLILLTSSQIVNWIGAGILIYAVCRHAHRLVILPQLETLH